MYSESHRVDVDRAFAFGRLVLCAIFKQYASSLRNRIGVCCIVNILCSFVVIRKTAVVVPVHSLFLVTTPDPPDMRLSYEMVASIDYVYLTFTIIIMPCLQTRSDIAKSARIANESSGEVRTAYNNYCDTMPFEATLIVGDCV